MTRRVARQLDLVLGHLCRASKFLASPTIEVCIHAEYDDMTAYRRLAPDETVKILRSCPSPFLKPIAKDIGSDLVGLAMGIDVLIHLIAAERERG